MEYFFIKRLLSFTAIGLIYDGIGVLLLGWAFFQKLQNKLQMRVGCM